MPTKQFHARLQEGTHEAIESLRVVYGLKTATAVVEVLVADAIGKLKARQLRAKGRRQSTQVKGDK